MEWPPPRVRPRRTISVAGMRWGTRAEYEEFTKLTADAIRYVYRTYLSGRHPTIHAPVTVEGSDWPKSVMPKVPDAFNGVDVHDSGWDA